MGSYRQFCPVAMAAEVLCTRWTIVLLREVRAAVARKRMVLTGSQKLASAMQTWLGLSPFAKERKLAS